MFGLTSLNEEQKSTLRSLHFWRRNQLIAKRDNDFPEVELSDRGIRHAMERADKEGVPFSLQNKVLHHAETKREEGFSDMEISKKEQVKKNLKENHTFKVVSLENEKMINNEEIARIIITNGFTGKEHSFAVWANDIENGKLMPDFVFLNNPQDLNVNREVDASISNSLSDNLYQTSLNELIPNSVGIENRIKEYHQNPEKTFDYEIPASELALNLHTMIVDEEITDLLLKTEQGSLTKEDVLNFGKLVKNDDLTYELENELKEPLQTIINENNFDAKEIGEMNSAFKVLEIEPDWKSLMVSKEVLQNLRESGLADLSDDEGRKVHPKEFLEKFQEMNAKEPKIILNENRETGMITMGVLVGKENLVSGDAHEFIPLSNKELSIFEYEPVVRAQQNTAEKELDKLNIDSLVNRSKELIHCKELMTIAGMSQPEAKEYLLENSTDEIVNPQKLDNFVESKGLNSDTIYDRDMFDGKDMLLKYELGTDEKYIRLNEIRFDTPPPAPNFDMYGQEIDSNPDWDYPTDTVYYELNEKDLTFIDSETKIEYPLENIMSEQQFQHLKESINSLDSTTIHLKSEEIESLKELTKEKGINKSFSNNKSLDNSLKNSKEEIEHSR